MLRDVGRSVVHWGRRSYGGGRGVEARNRGSGENVDLEKGRNASVEKDDEHQLK